jgi:hypothetical protein
MAASAKIATRPLPKDMEVLVRGTSIQDMTPVGSDESSGRDFPNVDSV